MHHRDILRCRVEGTSDFFSCINLWINSALYEYRNKFANNGAQFIGPQIYFNPNSIIITFIKIHAKFQKALKN